MSITLLIEQNVNPSPKKKNYTDPNPKSLLFTGHQKVFPFDPPSLF